MCGIAGIIYRDGSEHAIGDEMTRMLQAMKHRWPTRRATRCTAPPTATRHALQLADANTPRDFDFDERSRATAGRFAVKAAGRETRARAGDRYATGVPSLLDGDLKTSRPRRGHPDAEVLSLGHSLEIVKDLGDAETCRAVRPRGFNGTHAIGHVRMATSPTSTSPVRIPTGRIRSATSRSSTTAS
jgi:hypothetical protein